MLISMSVKCISLKYLLVNGFDQRWIVIFHFKSVFSFLLSLFLVFIFSFYPLSFCLDAFFLLIKSAPFFFSIAALRDIWRRNRFSLQIFWMLTLSTDYNDSLNWKNNSYQIKIVFKAINKQYQSDNATIEWKTFKWAFRKFRFKFENCQFDLVCFISLRPKAFSFNLYLLDIFNQLLRYKHL